LIECLSVGRDCGKCNPDVRELLSLHAPQSQHAHCPFPSSSLNS
jgi:bacterioferritin-associated ferredoxin